MPVLADTRVRQWDSAHDAILAYDQRRLTPVGDDGGMLPLAQARAKRPYIVDKITSYWWSCATCHMWLYGDEDATPAAGGLREVV